MQFTARINLEPKDLNSKMYSTLEHAVKKKFSGLCIPKLGYVKPGSVSILSKQIGKSSGTHFTGDMSFYVKVSALVTRPVKGQVIDALVISKHDTGVVARNYTLPYTLFIPKLPNDEGSDNIDRIQKNTHIRVEVLDSELNPPDKEVKKAEYWVVCKLNEIEVKSISRLDLPHVPGSQDWPILQPSIQSYDDINESRDLLTDSAYGALQEAKGLIERMNTDYAVAIAGLSQDLIEKDLIVATKFQYYNKKEPTAAVPDPKPPKSCVLAYVGEVVDHPEMSLLDVKILYIKVAPDNIDFQVGASIRIGVKKHVYYANSLVLLVDLSKRVEVWYADSCEELGIWNHHVKYVVNPYETIHISSTYRSQIEHFNRSLDASKKFALREKTNAISRAYYKMLELMNDLTFERNMQIACIAESPGGFIHALVEKRGTGVSNPLHDSIAAISLKSDQYEKEGNDRQNATWGQLKGKLRKIPGVRVESSNKVILEKGDINTLGETLVQLDVGDIYITEIRSAFYDRYDKAKADLVTADGGFFRDKTSSDTEELDTFRLLLAEVIMALRIQAPGGNFLLKIYDMATYSTIGLVSILAHCYSNSYVYKPMTSRNASSEKYVVCKGFRSDINALDDIIEGLEDILNNAGRLEDNVFLSKIMAEEDEGILTSVKHYNSIFMKKQGDFIRSGYEYAESYIKNIKKQSDLHSLIQTYAKTQEANSDDFHARH